MLKTIIICDKCGKKCKESGTFIKFDMFRLEVCNPNGDIDLEECWEAHICEKCAKKFMTSFENKYPTYESNGES